MKKVRYVGQIEVLLPQHGFIVNNGDVIEVEDDFHNALFELVEDKKKKAENKEVTN